MFNVTHKSFMHTDIGDRRSSGFRKMVYQRLRQLGVSDWGMSKTETRYLPSLLHSNEKIGGVIYGHSDEGSIMLAATDHRIIFLDTKPFFKKSIDISYSAVTGVTMEWVMLKGIVILHTRMGDYKVRTMNRKAAAAFKNYVEENCIEY